MQAVSCLKGWISNTDMNVGQIVFLFICGINCVPLLEVSSVHNGHNQTEFLLCLEGIRQRDNKATVHFLQYPLLHHRPLQEDMRKDSFTKAARLIFWSAAPFSPPSSPHSAFNLMCWCTWCKRMGADKWRARYNCAKKFHWEELSTKAPRNHSIPVSVV